MRRISAELCDPLELRTDSLVGVPGLLQAARAGKVTIGNALGSGSRRERRVLELPAEPEPVLLRRGARDSEHRDVVVRPAARARVRAEPPRRADRAPHLDGAKSVRDAARAASSRPKRRPRSAKRLIRAIERSGHDFVGQEPAALVDGAGVVGRELARRPRRSRCACTSPRPRTATR